MTGREWRPDQDTELVEAAAQSPGWDFHRVYGCFLALPEGTPYEYAFTLERLAEKVAERPESVP